MVTQYKIGGSFEPPVMNYKFYINCNYDCMKLRISADNPKWLQILLWDSNGSLRLQYLYWKAPETIIIHKDEKKTSSAAIPGLIPEGKWKMEVFGVEAGFDFNIDIQSGNSEINCSEVAQLIGEELWIKYDKNMKSLNLNNYTWDKKLNEAQRWYKGDFHTHTNISDGKLSPIELLEQAEKQKLDFFVTTEHNIIHTGFPSSRILVIPGIEITAPNGHFNALGIKKWVDWTVNSEDGGLNTEAGMNRILAEAKKAGAVCSINHPELAPWAWTFKETLLDNVDVLEIWNDPTYPDNNLKATEKALILWNTLWNDGYKIWGIGGSDAHNLPDETYEGSTLPSIIGDPGTFVLSDSLSADDILTAVHKGRIYVSRGITIDLKIEASGQEFFLGSDLTKVIEEDEKQVKYTIKICNADTDSRLIWIENGLVKEENSIPNNGEVQYCFSWKGKEYKWIRFEIRDENKKLLAFVNPIYKGEKQHCIFKWEQLIKSAGGIDFD